MRSKNLLLMLLCISTFTFTSCSTEDEIPVPTVVRTGTFMVADQTLRDNMLIISSVNVTQPSWLVLRRSSGDGMGEIISVPKRVSQGESTNVKVQLKAGVELTDGETVVAVLHKDTDNLGFFDFDGESDVDAPIMNDAGEVVMDTFTVTVLPDPTGSLTVDDQALINNILTIETLTLDRAGFVVVHADTADTGASAPVVPEIISEPVYLEAGTYTDVEIMIKESANVMEGDVVWVMLHTDTGVAKKYEFTGKSVVDSPILDAAGEIVMDPVLITEVLNDATGSLVVSDQVLTNNNINVASVTLGQAGYVVVHASNGSGGPMIPEIISQPVYLEEGTYENVIVPLLESADVNEGDTVWVMLHTDTGTEGVYEFDGQNGFDLPIVIDEEIVMEPLDITGVEMVAIAGKLVVQDQPLSDNNTITVETITLFEDGWVVIHASNATGGPMVPEIISVPVYLEAGRHEDVEITLLESANVEAQDVVWVMLHDDTGASGVYEFNGTNGLDLPIMVDGAVVVKPITITE